MSEYVRRYLLRNLFDRSALVGRKPGRVALWLDAQSNLVPGRREMEVDVHEKFLPSGCHPVVAPRTHVDVHVARARYLEQWIGRVRGYATPCVYAFPIQLVPRSLTQDYDRPFHATAAHAQADGGSS